MIKRITTIIMLLMFYGNIEAQELLSPSGACFIVDDYQLDWSLGESISNTNAGGDFILSHGFQQSVYNVVAINELNGDKYDISIFPNPTADFINLKILADDTRDIQFMLFNMKGVQVLSGVFINDVEELDFTTLEKGVYFLKIHKKNQIISSIKVIKK